MMGPGQPPVGGADLVVAGARIDAEDLVVRGDAGQAMPVGLCLGL